MDGLPFSTTAPFPALALIASLWALCACSDPANTGSGGLGLPDGAGTADGLPFFDGASADAASDSGSQDGAAPDLGGAGDSGASDAAEASDASADSGASDVADAPDVPGVADSVSSADAPDVPDSAEIVDASDVSGPDASDAGATFGPFTPLPCKKFVNLNADGTVNPFIAPARAGQFYVSWVQKGGNLMLTWEAPGSCKTTEGPFQVNKTAGDVYYWGGIAVVSDKAGNFSAVWESQTKGAEISLAWSTTGKDFSLPLEVVSMSTNGQDPALWVAQPGIVHAAWRGHHPTKAQYDPYFATSNDLLNTGKFTAGVPLAADAPQDDQVAIAADSKGNLYYAWQSFDGDIFASKSVDGGKSWTKGVQVNDVKGKANVGKATFLVVSADDRVVLMWSDERKQKSGNENDVFADSSADGVTWGADVQVNDDDARYQQDPSMAVGSGVGCKGAIYAVWQDFRSKKSYDVYISRSIDGGLTWQKNEAVANNLIGDEMNPAIAVDQACVVGVAWRDATKNTTFDIATTYLTW